MRRTFLTLALFCAVMAPVLANSFKTEKISLPTLQCESCKDRIETKLKGFKGLKSIDVSVDDQTATVVYDTQVTSIDKIEQAIANVGYDANKTKANATAQAKLPHCCQPSSK
jgi:copper chaperone CopZ